MVYPFTLIRYEPFSGELQIMPAFQALIRGVSVFSENL